MEYSDAKVYFDGSHYIAIPKVEQPWKKRKKQTIKTNQVLNENNLSQESKVSKTEATRSSEDSEIVATAKIDLKMLFETLYIENLNNAVAFAKKNTKQNKICLLSPAAPSYGYFKNFEDRGNCFKNLAIFE